MKPNPHFARVPRDKLPEHMKAGWDNSNRILGDTTFVEVFGNAPHLYDWYGKDFYEKLFYKGRLDRKILELVRLRLANIHGCAFCNRFDRKEAREAGVPQEQIDGLPDYENGPFSEREKAALALADVMVLTNPKGHVTKAIYDRARAHFSDGEMVELGVVMAVLSGMAKMVFAFDLVEKEDYCPFTPERLAAE